MSRPARWPVSGNPKRRPRRRRLANDTTAPLAAATPAGYLAAARAGCRPVGRNGRPGKWSALSDPALVPLGRGDAVDRHAGGERDQPELVGDGCRASWLGP